MNDARCHILFVIPTLAGGGAERVIVNLLKHIDPARFRLTLAVVDTRDAVYLKDLPQHVRFIDLSVGRVRYALPVILRLVWAQRPRIVFSTLGHLNLALAIIKPMFPKGVRIIGRETSIVTEAIKKYPYMRLWAWVYRRFYCRLDWVVSQSKAMRGDLVNRYAFPSEKVSVIYNPLDLDHIAKMVEGAADCFVGLRSPGKINLVAAGRFSREKGFDILIEAIRDCKDLRVHLTLLGDGPLNSSLRLLADECGVSDRVAFVGFQKNPYSWFARADALVLSSHYEGLPNVVLEALACGTPVISTPAIGGVREIIEKIPQCELAEEVSASALASAIKRWVDRNPGRVGREVVLPYEINRIVKQYEEVFMGVGDRG